MTIETFLSILFEYSLSTSNKRTVWLYRKGNYDALSENIINQNRNYLSESNVDDATKRFETDILSLAKQTIPTNAIAGHRNDNSEISKCLRIRNRLKSKAKK